VKYTKQNFLYNRPFCDIDTLNQEALAWLLRTANQLPHNGTKKEPYAQWNIEKPFLQPYTACPTKPALVFYTIRKDNTISWKSNFYSLPLGSYKGRGSEVAVQVENNQLVLCHADGTEICRHLIAVGSGQKVKKVDHARDKTSAIAEIMQQLCTSLDNPGKGMEFFQLIRQSKPRYIRDQLLLFRSVAEKADRLVITEALEYCCQNKVNSAGDFQAVVEQYTQRRQTEQAMGRVLQMNPLSGFLPAEALMQPATSAIADYEIILQIKY
jgi:hypothetical protein